MAWTIENIEAINYLHVETHTSSYWGRDEKIEGFLSSFATLRACNLKDLVVHLPLGNHPSFWRVSPSAPMLRSLQLRNCWYSGLPPLQLQILHATFEDGSIDVSDLLQFLVGTPQLKVCFCNFRAPQKDLTGNLHAPCDTPVNLPNLEHLALLGLRSSHTHWVYDRIATAEIFWNNLSIRVFDTVESFDLPALLKEHIERSDSLCLHNSLVIYALDNHFRHTFEIDHPSGPISPESPTIGTILPLFVHIRNLSIRLSASMRQAELVRALGDFKQLQDLHIFGSETLISYFLPYMTQADRIPCPTLISLTLEHAQEWTWSMPGSPKPIAIALPMAWNIEAMNSFEAFLEDRVARARALERLTLLGDLLGNICWAQEIDRWRKYVGVVEYRSSENRTIDWSDSE